jgi:hypothetical protein
MHRCRGVHHEHPQCHVANTRLTMYLNTIETSPVDRIARSFRVEMYVLFYLFLRQRPRDKWEFNSVTTSESWPSRLNASLTASRGAVSRCCHYDRECPMLALFHEAICSLFHIPGMWLYPPACGAIIVASAISNVPEDVRNQVRVLPGTDMRNREIADQECSLAARSTL